MTSPADIEQAVAAERDRIAKILAVPLLAALRCIPDGFIRKGCIVSDGATVRENARQAYLAVRNGRDAPSQTEVRARIRTAAEEAILNMDGHPDPVGFKGWDYDDIAEAVTQSVMLALGYDTSETAR